MFSPRHLTTTSTLLALVGAVALVSTLFSQSAEAVGVTGTIGFTGSATPNQASGPSGTTTITFNGPMAVDIRTGDYSGIPVGTTTGFALISWTGSGINAVLASNNSPEWTITLGGTTYQYSIVSLLSATSNAQGPFSLQGDGIATIAGAFNREATYLTFNLQGTGGAAFFTAGLNFCIPGQCGGGPRLVPEGGSAIALLGIAFAGLTALRSRWRTV